MKIIKILLSLIALLAAALATTVAAGGLKWNPAGVDLITSGATLLGTFGVSPFALSLSEKRACAGIAAFAAAVVTAHAAGTIPGTPWVFNVVGAGAAVLATLGRWDAPATPAAKV